MRMQQQDDMTTETLNDLTVAEMQGYSRSQQNRLMDSFVYHRRRQACITQARSRTGEQIAEKMIERAVRGTEEPLRLFPPSLTPGELACMCERAGLSSPRGLGYRDETPMPTETVEGRQRADVMLVCVLLFGAAVVVALIVGAVLMGVWG